MIGGLVDWASWRDLWLSITYRAGWFDFKFGVVMNTLGLVGWKSKVNWCVCVLGCFFQVYVLLGCAVCRMTCVVVPFDAGCVGLSG